MGAAFSVQPDETLEVGGAYFLAADGSATGHPDRPLIIMLATVDEKVRECGLGLTRVAFHRLNLIMNLIPFRPSWEGPGNRSRPQQCRPCN